MLLLQPLEMLLVNLTGGVLVVLLTIEGFRGLVHLVLMGLCQLISHTSDRFCNLKELSLLYTFNC